MSCVSVELSSQPTSARRSKTSRQPPQPSITLHPCTECGAPMLLMSVTHALEHPIKLRKTYQCMVCESVEVLVAPAFE